MLVGNFFPHFPTARSTKHEDERTTTTTVFVDDTDSRSKDLRLPTHLVWFIILSKPLSCLGARKARFQVVKVVLWRCWLLQHSYTNGNVMSIATLDTIFLFWLYRQRDDFVARYIHDDLFDWVCRLEPSHSTRSCWLLYELAARITLHHTPTPSAKCQTILKINHNR